MKLVDTNPKTRFGLAKPGIADVPPGALVHLGLAMRDGARKYGRMNYRAHPVTASVYYEAAMRHLMAWWDGEDNATDSGIHHLGHVMACCAILLDTEAQDTLNDDRPKPAGRFAELIARFTSSAPGQENDAPDTDEWHEPGIEECVRAANDWLNAARDHAEEINRSRLLHDWLAENNSASLSELEEPYQRVLFATWLRGLGGRI